MIDAHLAQGLASPEVTEAILEAAVRILGYALLAAGTGAIAAFVFRWFAAEEIPDGVAVLLGISPVAIWLNTQTALHDATAGTSELLDAGPAVYTIAAFAASAIAADAGRRLGSFVAREVFSMAGGRTMDEVGELVRAAGRVVSVELPGRIDDVDGYDPVDEATKAELAGETFLFPRRLSTEELRERLVARLERDFGIGHVDVELGDRRTVRYLAVGGRAAGIGPTLAPGTVAVAIRADPAPDATPGDAVRIWRHDGDGARRVAGGELRGIAEDVATVAVDADDADPLVAPESGDAAAGTGVEVEGGTELGAGAGSGTGARDGTPAVAGREAAGAAVDDSGTESTYRLVTLPGEPSAGREFVSLLRAADETVTTVEVGPDDPLAGEPAGAVPVVVLAIERPSADGDRSEPIALPGPDRPFDPGDVAYVLGRPEVLRRIAARTDDPEWTPAAVIDST